MKIEYEFKGEHMKKYRGLFVVLIGVLVDQITKIIVLTKNVDVIVIPNLLNFTLVKNYGAAFGLAQGSNEILAFISFIICALLLGIIVYEKYSEDTVSLSLCMVLAGGIGNLLDRLFRGFVVDFIDTPFIATFNIADSLIVVGSFLVILIEVLKSVFSKKPN